MLKSLIVDVKQADLRIKVSTTAAVAPLLARLDSA